MESSEDEIEIISPDVSAAASILAPNMIPEISKEKYTNAYNLFNDWRTKQNANSFSENLLLDYFVELSTKFKATTLWTNYSMLRTTLNIYDNVDITHCRKLKLFLKRKSAGYQPKKSKVFTSGEINKFFKEATDAVYLLEKVVLIMGILGACRRLELYQMKLTDFKYLGSAVLVVVPQTKTKMCKKFTITGKYFEIFKKYADLRPKNINDSWFFCNYQKGKCTMQRVGINKFGSMGKQIAVFLKLPNPEQYTGHCFRKSSASILADSDEDIRFSKRHGRDKSTTKGEGYIDGLFKNNQNVTNKILDAIENSENSPSTSVDRIENTENLILDAFLESSMKCEPEEPDESELDSNDNFENKNQHTPKSRQNVNKDVPNIIKFINSSIKFIKSIEDDKKSERRSLNSPSNFPKVQNAASAMNSSNKFEIKQPITSTSTQYVNEGTLEAPNIVKFIINSIEDERKKHDNTPASIPTTSIIQQLENTENSSMFDEINDTPNLESIIKYEQEQIDGSEMNSSENFVTKATSTWDLIKGIKDVSGIILENIMEVNKNLTTKSNDDDEEIDSFFKTLKLLFHKVPDAFQDDCKTELYNTVMKFRKLK